MPIAVRPARPDELGAAGTVVRLAYESDGLVAGRYADVLADAAGRARDADVVVAVDAGTVVASVTFVLPGSRWAELSHPGEAEFRMLGVHPDARGRGIGEALVSWCTTRARDLGCHRLLLCSMDVMAGAHRLYERLGFRRRPDLDWSPEEGVLLLGFSLDLASRP